MKKIVALVLLVCLVSSVASCALAATTTYVKYNRTCVSNPKMPYTSAKMTTATVRTHSGTTKKTTVTMNNGDKFDVYTVKTSTGTYKFVDEYTKNSYINQNTNAGYKFH